MPNLDFLLNSIFASSETSFASITMPEFLLCSAVSLALGFVIGLVYRYKNSTSDGFVVAMGLLPIIVQTVILLVNGNVGAAVAVMGVFSLVRFRSMPGSARDIVTVFEAMAVGLATGMGFLGLPVLMVIIVSIATIIYARTPKAAMAAETSKLLKISVPEDVDYDELFEPILDKYCSYSLESVETANMGSLYSLKYLVKMKPEAKTKEMIDEIRTVNGNLKVSLSTAPKEKGTL